MSTAQAVLSALSGYGIKKEGEGRYRLNSPLRPGSNSHGFSLTIEDDEHGAFIDRVSNESGSLYELAKRLNIDTGRVSVPSTKRAYKDMSDYAAAHALDVKELQRAGWKQTTKAGRPALEFSTDTGRRWRFIDTQGGYVSEKGYKACWYGLTRPVAESIDAEFPLVICNGEATVIAAQMHNIPAVCVTSGEKENISSVLIEELAQTLMGDSILVALDCDDTGRRCAAGIVAQLNAAGFKARAVDLGLSKGGDLADFCLLYGPIAHKRLMECPPLTDGAIIEVPKQEFETYGLPREKLLGAGNGWIMLYSDDLRYLPMVKWLLKPYIPEHGQVAIFGPSGTGKSFLALWFALSIAQTQNVLYMAYEGEFGYQARIRAAQLHYKFNRGVHLTLGQVDLMGDEEYTAFIDQARKIGPSVVFIDTLAMSMVGMDENSQRDMGIYTARCKRLARELNAAVVVVHHTNKGGIVERGSTALRGTMDVMIRLEEADDKVLVECAKTKDGKPFQSFYIRLHSVDTGLVDEDMMPVMTPVAVVAHDEDISDSLLTKHQRTILTQMILEVYEDDGMTPAQIKETCPQMSKGTLDGAISALKRQGYIAQSAKREPYTITEAGRAALSGGKPWIPPVEAVVEAAKPAKQGSFLPKRSGYHEAGL